MTKIITDHWTTFVWFAIAMMFMCFADLDAVYYLCAALAASLAAYDAMTTHLRDERNRASAALVAATKSFQDITKLLKEARARLESTE